MCGISGIINCDKDQFIDITELSKMTDVIKHRGPDGYGYWTYRNIGLGHRRLSIIDKEGSAQPMSIEEENFTLTYNGEVYNFQELKEELVTLGATFKTKGDTEVVLRSYEQWGVACLHRFRGMFSFAIVDKVKQEVFLARDHFGIKPLLYYTGKDHFLFGSEIQQLVKHSSFKKEINYNALSEYLKFGYIPSPLTIYSDVHKLDPGNYIRVNFEGEIIEKREYYDLDFKPNQAFSYEHWVEETEKAIDTSVNYHKIADVPYGAFLSGGIDSSLIASSLAKQGKGVDAFTMGFDNKQFNEVPYAKEVARKYDLKHHIEYVDMSDVEDVLPKLVQHYGEPFSDSSAIPTYYITKKIRETLPVVLSGDGGDEAFGGYYSYQNFLKIAAPNAPKHHYKNQIKSLLKHVGMQYPTTPRKPDINDWINLVSYHNEEKAARLLNEDVLKEVNTRSEIYHKWYEKAKTRGYDTYTTASYLDYKTYIHGDILTKVDIASMMNSLEVRTPLIDKEIIDLMSKIPSKYKIGRNREGAWNKKMILNSIAEKRFGTHFIQRKKQGFSVPLQDWFSEKTAIGNDFKTIITNKNSEIYNYLDFNAINQLGNENPNHKYQLYFLEKWLANQ
ncbi:MAG: asparagine synthase (glutamine-hydrolyzing) [Flavobacteriaceae bacterium]|nr:asparagine synthase (glutamine-hydrolyzing) [Flavobacteriaceae bacterium]